MTQSDQPTPGQTTFTSIPSPVDDTLLASLEEQTLASAPWGHRLHDYFRESLGIVRRLLASMEADRQNGHDQRAEQSSIDAARLCGFLAEEVVAARDEDEATWTDLLVTDHGLIGDGETDNGPALRALLDDIDTDYTRLVFPAGVYYVTNEPGHSTIELRGLRNVCFQGRGHATLLCDGRANSGHNIDIEHCHGLTFEDLTLDNRPTPFTVGRMSRIVDDRRIEVEICPGHPVPDASYATARYPRGRVYDPVTGLMRRDCGDPRIAEMEELRPGRYRITLDDNALSGASGLTEKFNEGELFSIHPRQRPGGACGVTITASRHLLFSHVTVRAGELMLFRVNSSVGVKFIDCTLEPAPGRYAMSNGDGLHCRSNAKGVYVERCRLFGMNDDCLNFYSAMLSVGEVQDANHLVLCGKWDDNETSANFRPGDRIALFNPNTGKHDARTVVTAVEAVDWGNQQGQIRLTTAEPLENIRGRREIGRPDHIPPREYTISGADNYRAAMAVDAPFEHMVLNLNAKNDGFIVRNCDMGRNRATGFKCKGTNGVIRNTRFRDQILLLQSEPSWREGTYPANILIADVVADYGVRCQCLLPDRRLYDDAVREDMPHLVFQRVYDRHGTPLQPFMPPAD